MVTHEPECPNIPEHFVPEDSILWPAVCHCDTARSAYQRGREDAAKEVNRRYATEFTWDELLAIVRGNGEQE